jgi:hypothetical protein
MMKSVLSAQTYSMCHRNVRIVTEVSRFAALNAREMKQNEVKWSTLLLLFLYIAVIFTCRIRCEKK